MSAKKENQGAASFHLGAFLTKYSMVIALIVVFILFYFLTGGRLLYAQNMSNLLLQNGYVLVMACGMLLCILTGGNIDLSVGSVICMIGHQQLLNHRCLFGTWTFGRCLAGVLDRLCQNPAVYHNAWRYVHLPWNRTSRFGQQDRAGTGRSILKHVYRIHQDSGTGYR